MPSQPQLLQQDFTAGIRRNRSRDDLGAQRGANVLWNSTDWIINRLGVPLGKRGGWSYAGSAFSGSPSRVRAIADAPMNGGHYLLAVDSSGQVYRTAGATPGTWAVDGTTRNVGTLLQNPYFFLDTMIFPSPDGATTLSQANENTVTSYSTGTFKPTYICGHYGRLVGTVNETLIFGPPGAPNQTWDDAAAYDLSQPTRGVWSSGVVLLVFYDGHIDRVTGHLPAGYGVTTDDITIQPFSQDVGCIDAFTICGWQGTVIFADKHGVWQTDGVARPLDLCWAGGASDLYADFMSVYDPTNHRVAAGIIQDLLVVSITNKTTNAAVDTLICDLPRRVWYRFSNCPFTCFARNTRNAQETWAGVETVSGRVAALNSIFSPTSSNSSDANGTAVLPSFETAYYRFSATDARVHSVWMGYEIDYLSGQESSTGLTITYATDPKAATTFTGPTTFYPKDNHGTASKGYHWKNAKVRQASPGVAIKVTQTAASAKTSIHALGIEQQPLPLYNKR